MIKIVFNSLLTNLKLANSPNKFNYKLKEHFFKNHKNTEQDIFAY